MVSYSEQREKALRHVNAADHMLAMTYPLLNEPKLLLTIVENIFIALETTLNTVLESERRFKAIPAYPAHFEAKLDVFLNKIVPKYRLDKGYVQFLREIKNIMRAHEESAIEFSKKDTLVICSDKYDLSTITLKDLHSYVNKAKIFIHEMNKVTLNNERAL